MRSMNTNKKDDKQQEIMFLEACYQGDSVKVKEIIDKLHILDLSNIKGLQQEAKFSFHRTLGQISEQSTKSYDMSTWNPLLIAIYSKQVSLVKLIFHEIPCFHRINMLSKPYSLETQKTKVFDQGKRLKRECFSLKLAILNQDEEMFKYLWSEQTTRGFWNVGHFMQCLKYIVNCQWEQGLRNLFASTTTKVVLMSVNTSSSDFIEVLQLIQQELQTYKAFAYKVKEGFMSRSYLVYAYFLELSNPSDIVDQKMLLKCLNQLTQDDLQLTYSQLVEVFHFMTLKTLDKERLKIIQTSKRLFLAKFHNRDEEISKSLRKLEKAYSNKEFNCQEILDILDDLDLFAFSSEIVVNGIRTNALFEALKNGLDQIVDYAFNDGYINLRSILKRNNFFEIRKQELSHTNVSFFQSHFGEDLKFIKKLYFYLIDYLQLGSIFEIFDDLLTKASKDKVQKIAEFVLCDLRFKSLFQSSLEFQKYLFTKELLQLAITEVQQDIIDPLMNQEPYIAYVKQIESGNYGLEYTSRTLQHLQQVNPQIGISSPGWIKGGRINSLGKKKRRNYKFPQVQQPSLVQETQIDPLDSPRSQKSLLKFRPLTNQPFELKYKTAEQQDHSQVSDDFGEENALSPEFKKQSSIPMQAPILRLHNTQQMVIKTMSSTALRASENVGINSERMVMISEDQHSDEADEEDVRQLSKRVPQATTQIKTQFKKNQEQSSILSGSNKPLKMLNFDKVHSKLIELIRLNNVTKIKSLLKKFNIRNIANIKNFDPIRASPSLFIISHNNDNHSLSYETALWNPLLYAIYYQCTDIVKLFLSEYIVNPILAMRMPPANDYNQYIMPNQFRKRPLLLDDSSIDFGSPENRNNLMSSRGGQELNSLQVFSSPNPKKNSVKEQLDVLLDDSYLIPTHLLVSEDRKSIIMPQPIPLMNEYNPSDARVECFGLELSIRNHDTETFKYLWNEQGETVIWEERHFSKVYDLMLQQKWDTGLQILFRSRTAHVIFRSMTPEDKDNFISIKLMDKLIDKEYWNSRNLNVTKEQLEIVLTELSFDPYGSYSVLKYPQMFAELNLLDKVLKKVNSDDIYDFIVARRENVEQLKKDISLMRYQSEYMKGLTDLCFKVEKLHIQMLEPAYVNYRIKDNNPHTIIDFIKKAEYSSLIDYFELTSDLINRLPHLTGYEDPDYQKLLQTSVKYVPTDEVMRFLITDSTTEDWNPLIYAIFYQRLDVIEYFCSRNPMVYVRTCLVKPFFIEAQDDELVEGGSSGADDDDKFILEKSELFSLVLCIMLHNRDIFRYLLRKCCYLWNDAHLALLTNYVLEAQWTDGMKILFTSSTTHQLFNAMNLFEKEKYLKFCEQSVCKNLGSSTTAGFLPRKSTQQSYKDEQPFSATLLSDFRYLMSFDPYNVYYLPLIATIEDLKYWDNSLLTEDSVSKELFFRTCLINFDERAYAMVKARNPFYIKEFVEIVGKNFNIGEKLSLKMFVKKLIKFQQ